jgi:hypothetical protein
MDKYYARVIMSSKDINYDKMFMHCEIIELQQSAQAGEVLDNMLILSEDNPFERKIINEFEKGHFVRAIPLRYISLCTSPFDLSAYGFEPICKEDDCIKWCDFSKMPQKFIMFERALQNKGIQE